jgi:hypothetical protein
MRLYNIHVENISSAAKSGWHDDNISISTEQLACFHILGQSYDELKFRPITLINLSYGQLVMCFPLSLSLSLSLSLWRLRDLGKGERSLSQVHSTPVIRYTQ